MIKKYFSEIFLVRRKNFRRITPVSGKFSGKLKNFLGNLIMIVGSSKKFSSGRPRTQTPDTENWRISRKSRKVTNSWISWNFVKFRSRGGPYTPDARFFQRSPTKDRGLGGGGVQVNQPLIRRGCGGRISWNFVNFPCPHRGIGGVEFPHTYGEYSGGTTSMVPHACRKDGVVVHHSAH